MCAFIVAENFTAGLAVSIVHISATSKKGLEEMMTRRMLRLEARYQIMMIIMRSLLRQGIINERDYKESEEMMMKKYRPASGKLFSNLT